MCEAAPLKTREYLAAGTAVYASYQDVFPDTFEFFRCGPVSIEKILSFSRLVVNSTRQDVSIASCPYIDKETLLKSLYFDSLSTVINSKNL